MRVSLTTFCIKCHYAECRDLFIVMMNVIMLSVIMLSVIMLNVVMLDVVAPEQKCGMQHVRIKGACLPRTRQGQAGKPSTGSQRRKSVIYAKASFIIIY
jgi:hypothetical protein